MSLKKKYIKRMYIEEVFCDKCGAPMVQSDMVLLSYPMQYPFHCTNSECNHTITFYQGEVPGTLKFEYEEEEADV